MYYNAKGVYQRVANRICPSRTFESFRRAVAACATCFHLRMAPLFPCSIVRLKWAVQLANLVWLRACCFHFEHIQCPSPQNSLTGTKIVLCVCAVAGTSNSPGLSQSRGENVRQIHLDFGFQAGERTCCTKRKCNPTL